MLINSSALNTVNVNSAGLVEASEVTDALACTDTLEGWMVSPLRDDFSISDTIDLKAHYIAALTDSISVNDLLTIVLNGTASDSATIDDVSIGLARLLGEITDALVMGDVVSSRLQALGIIADHILLSDEAKHYFAGFVTDAFALSDSLAVRAILIGALLEAMGVSDDATPYIRLYGLASDALMVGDDISPRARLIGALEDGISFTIIMSLPDGEYLAYVVNTKTLATTKYLNYPFNSFATLNGIAYGLTDTGLYELTGATDDGTDIDAVIKTAFTNLGTSLKKHIPRAYLGYTTDGRLVLKTVTSHSGQKFVRWYQLSSRTADAYREARVQLARGVESVYWQFELINADGADFAIDTLQVLPMVLSRRIG